MDKIKIKEDLNNSVAILQNNIELFYQGKKEMYVVIANELRKLICDRNITKPNSKDKSLLPKIFSAIKLFSVKNVDKEIKSNSIFQSFGSIQFSGNGVYKITNLFDEKKPKILLDEWLKQRMMFSGIIITLEEFIKSISEREAVHADDNYNETIHRVKFFKVGDDDTRRHYIVAIGEYLLKEIKENAKPLLQVNV